LRLILSDINALMVILTPGSEASLEKSSQPLSALIGCMKFGKATHPNPHG
jgi:hypothetical protein